jgi:hypothetical protein
VKLLATTDTRNDTREGTGSLPMDEGQARCSGDTVSFSWPQRILLVALWHSVMADTPYLELVTGLGREALQAELAPLARRGLIRQAPEPPAFSTLNLAVTWPRRGRSSTSLPGSAETTQRCGL